MNIFQFIKSAIQREEKQTETTHSRDRIVSQDLVNEYLKDPEFPQLISFSRTGSHWLRNLMELYLDKPGMKLLFYRTVAEATDYSCFHTHDLDLKVEGRNVIYLYRDPVDTIYSQMTYHAQDFNNEKLLEGWIDLYARHLNKWLIEEKFTVKKTVLRYELMRKDLKGEMKKISEFFNVPFDAEKVDRISAGVSKESIKEKTKHDPRVINLDKGYDNSRESFRARYAKTIYDGTFSRFPELRKFLS